MARQNCTLNYTLSASESSRAPLEVALENDGWNKTEYEQQTRWTGSLDESKFISSRPDGTRYWDRNKIDPLFVSYFSEVKKGEQVNAKFVLTVGGSEDYIIRVSGKAPLLSASSGKAKQS